MITQEVSTFASDFGSRQKPAPATGAAASVPAPSPDRQTRMIDVPASYLGLDLAVQNICDERAEKSLLHMLDRDRLASRRRSKLNFHLW